MSSSSPHDGISTAARSHSNYDQHKADDINTTAPVQPIPAALGFKPQIPDFSTPAYLPILLVNQTPTGVHPFNAGSPTTSRSDSTTAQQA